MVSDDPESFADLDGHCCWDDIKSFAVGVAKELHNMAADTAVHGFQVAPTVAAMPLPAADGEANGLTGMGAGGEAQPVIASPSNSMETAGMVTTVVAPLVLSATGSALLDDAATGGRLGSASTRAQNATIADSLESRGFTVTGGGGRLPEEYIPGPGGGTKGSNYVDVTAVKNGRTVRVQTIDTRTDGVTPTTSEANAAARIRSQQQSGDHTVLIPKKKP